MPVKTKQSLCEVKLGGDPSIPTGDTFFKGQSIVRAERRYSDDCEGDTFDNTDTYFGGVTRTYNQDTNQMQMVLNSVFCDTGFSAKSIGIESANQFRNQV